MYFFPLPCLAEHRPHLLEQLTDHPQRVDQPVLVPPLTTRSPVSKLLPFSFSWVLTKVEDGPGTAITGEAQPPPRRCRYSAEVVTTAP